LPVTVEIVMFKPGDAVISSRYAGPPLEDATVVSVGRKTAGVRAPGVAPAGSEQWVDELGRGLAAAIAELDVSPWTARLRG
jgi:hypothetical protein